jgi:sulfur carrier protein
MVIIKVNGDPQTILEESISVAGLLSLNKVEMPEMVSVQLNGEFLDHKAFSITTLKNDDEVDFLYFMGGGEVAG